MVYAKRVIIGHGKFVGVRLNEELLRRAHNFVASHNGQYDNLSHFIRAAMIKVMNEEFEQVKQYESNRKKKFS